MKENVKTKWEIRGLVALAVLLVGAIIATISFGIWFFTTYSYEEEVVGYQYELVAAEDQEQIEGYISGNRWHIHGEIGNKDVYKIRYFVDTQTRETDYLVLETNETRVFFDVKEGDTPYLVVKKNATYKVNLKTGTKEEDHVSEPIGYELHVPENAIIRDYEFDFE